MRTESGHRTVTNANGDISKFTGVKVDGMLIDAANYTADSGSTVITLKTDYLNTLSVGTHTLTVVYNDDECSTNFEIKSIQSTVKDNNSNNDDDKNTTQDTGIENPQTDDNANLALKISILAVSVSGIAVTAVYSRKNE